MGETAAISFIMVSLFYEQSWSVDQGIGLQSNTDSTILDWGTEVDRMNTQGGRDGYRFYGIFFDNQSDNTTVGDVESDDIQFWFCRFEGNASGVQVGESTTRRTTFKYCLFHDNGAVVTFIQWAVNARDPRVEHCTFMSNKASKAMEILDNAVSADSIGLFRNNIVSFTGDYGDNNAFMDHDEPDELFDDWNYNMYFVSDAGFPTQGGFEWDVISPPINFAAWKDSLQNGVKGTDPNGENKSFFQDPLLIAGSNYGLIATNSFARRNASDGTNIGFWQESKSLRRRGLHRKTR